MTELLAWELGDVPSNWKLLAQTLIHQGLARTLQDTGTEKRILRAILNRDPATWTWNRETACLALVISRSETAPSQLSRQDVDRIGQRIIRDMEGAIGTEYTKFYYTNLLAGGIFRYRQFEPYALLVERDPLADRLFGVFDAVRRDFAVRSHPSEGFIKYLPIMEDLLRYLRGEDGNPGLLVSSYNA